MQRHWSDDEAFVIKGHMSQQMLRDHFGKPNLAPVFQTQHNLRRRIAICHNRADAIMAWGFCKARRAVLVALPLEWQRHGASGAPWCPEIMNLLPAFWTKGTARRGDRAAGRAALRQNKIERWPQKVERSLHSLLFNKQSIGTRPQMDKPDTPPEIFDRKRRMAMRKRGISRGGASFLWQHLADDLADRLAYVSRDFVDVLIIGPMTAYAATIVADRQVNITAASLTEEDRLPFPPQSFDLIIAAGTLDSVNDLPGALIQMRRCLRPDGLLLGSVFGAGSLAQLKSSMLAADGDHAAPHIHPQIDLRTMADLLSRTGFALPVADSDVLPVRYGNLVTLIGDLRDMGIGNALAGPRRYLGKTTFARLHAKWGLLAEQDGKVEERFVLSHFSGWAPSPDQPKAAKRGSGTVSLAEALKHAPD